MLSLKIIHLLTLDLYLLFLLENRFLAVLDILVKPHTLLVMLMLLVTLLSPKFSNSILDLFIFTLLLLKQGL